MKKFLLCLISVLLCSVSAAAQEYTATPDPFQYGSFYITPTAVPTVEESPNEKRLGRDEAEMVYIPAGKFTMGTDDEFAALSEKPAHEVSLTGFWIDKYPVTNAQFAKCAETGNCFAPRELSSATREDYYENPSYADYPVVHVDRNQAVAYCQWAGKRLPTEAEWEKAARGNDGRRYPWGNELPALLPIWVNKMDGGDTVAVGTFPDNVSVYGVMDLLGNVWEWTADNYDAGYYKKSPARDPKAVLGTAVYSVRGLSWAYPFTRYDLTLRSYSLFNNHTHDLGFRCAMDE